MKMKRYFAPDSRQALRALRDDQGPDAVILSNRNVNGGVEIIAAMDYEEAMENVALDNDEESIPGNNNFHKGTVADTYKESFQDTSEVKKETESISYVNPQRDSNLYETQMDETRETSGEDRVNNNFHHEQNSKNDFDTTSFDKLDEWPMQETENVSALNKIKDELAGLRSIMEAPLMQFSWGETDRVRPLYASLLKQLTELGLSSKLSQSIAKKLAKEGLSKQSWGESLSYLSDLIPVNQEDIISTGGIVSLVGPTGVGKTTTIAKLAAHFALKYGRKGVTLITTDNYRIGAHEQLRSYGRILGIPVHVASDSEELKQLLKNTNQNSGEHQLTLIDTAGVSQKDINLTEQITSLDVDGIDIKNYLVLSATGQMNLQDEVVKAFSMVDLSGCVITKTDEAASLGEVLSVIIQHNLPVSYICNGQKVPDDIHQAHGRALVKEAVTLMKNLNKSLSDEELAYTFGGEMNNASF